MKHTLSSRVMALCLAAALLLGMGPLIAPAVSAVETTASYSAADGTDHTIYWTQGITAPSMPDDFQVHSFRDGDGADCTLYAAPYAAGHGWYDLNKDEESNRGYAVTAANLTHWWLDQNSDYIQKYLEKNPEQSAELAKPADVAGCLTGPSSQNTSDSAVYGLYDSAYGTAEDAGVHPDMVLDFFLNGYAKKDDGEVNSPDAFVPSAQGGFFYPVFGKNLLTRRDETAKTYSDASKNLKEYLSQGYGIGLAADGLMMTLWGAEYDKAGNLCAVYVTDADDGADAAQQGMVRYAVHPDSTGNARMTVKNAPKADEGAAWSALYLLELGTSYWESYLNIETPSLPDNTPVAVPKGTDVEYAAGSIQSGVPAGEGYTLSGDTSAEEPGAYTVTATLSEGCVWEDGSTNPVTITWNILQPAQPEQVWGETAYTWAEDFSTCTAKRVDNQDNAETAEAVVTHEQTKAPTDKKTGVMTHVATFSVEWAETDTRNSDIPKLEHRHNWGKTTYEWEEDGSACTAKRVCKDDDTHVETAGAKVSREQTKAPTDKKTGIMTYTAEFAEDWAETQSMNTEIPKVEIQWDTPIYAWSTDNQYCIATRTDKNDPGNQQTVKVKASAEQTKAPTCTEKGETTYIARFDEAWAQTQSKSEQNIPTIDHKWGETSYNWSEDGSSCTAVRACEYGHQETAAAKVTGKVTKDPTTTTKGQTTYTAEFGESWAKQQKKTLEDIPAASPDWNPTEYTWSKDLRICTATRTAKNDSNNVQTAEVGVTSKETKAPTCLEKGETTYTAAFQEAWAGTQTKVLQNIDTLTPNWGDTSYHWSDDHHKCVAKRVCKNEDNHVEQIEANVTSKVTKKPTAAAKGQTTYTAEFHENWAKTQKATVEDIPKSSGGSGSPDETESSGGTKWSTVTYEWSTENNRCTASRHKIGDKSNVQMAAATVTEKEIKKATCTERGQSVITAKFKESWAKDQEKTVEVPKLTHKLEKISELPATASTEGVAEHYRCSLCERLFADEKGLKEVTAAQLVIEKPAVGNGNVIVNAVPEKDGTVAMSPEKLREAMEKTQSGITITVGDASVTYDKKAAEAILKQAKDSKKLVLSVVKTDAADSDLTLDQVKAAEKNKKGSLYKVNLSYVVNGKNVEITSFDQGVATITVPYQGDGQNAVRVYRLEEDGSFTTMAANCNNGFLTWRSESHSFYLAAQEAPAHVEPEKSGGGKTGMIIWLVILILSGVLCVGLGGYYLYLRFVVPGQNEGKDNTPKYDRAPRFDHIPQYQPGKKPSTAGRPQQAKVPAAPGAGQTVKTSVAPAGTAQQPRTHAAPAGTAQQSQAHAAPTGTAQQPQAHAAPTGTAQQPQAHVAPTGAAQQPKTPAAPNAVQTVTPAAAPKKTLADKAVSQAEKRKALKPEQPASPRPASRPVRATDEDIDQRIKEDLAEFDKFLDL